MYISERNRKDRERSELFDQNYLIGTEHISVHPRTVCLETADGENL